MAVFILTLSSWLLIWRNCQNWILFQSLLEVFPNLVSVCFYFTSTGASVLFDNLNEMSISEWVSVCVRVEHWKWNNKSLRDCPMKCCFGNRKPSCLGWSCIHTEWNEIKIKSKVVILFHEAGNASGCQANESEESHCKNDEQRSSRWLYLTESGNVIPRASELKIICGNGDTRRNMKKKTLRNRRI